jgi:hypothetical protein
MKSSNKNVITAIQIRACYITVVVYKKTVPKNNSALLIELDLTSQTPWNQYRGTLSIYSSIIQPTVRCGAATDVTVSGGGFPIAILQRNATHI